MLQWGHALLSVETTHLRAGDELLVVLQWGHALLSVETAAQGALSSALPLASMGPRSFKRGNVTSVLGVAQDYVRFNGATLF